MRQTQFGAPAAPQRFARQVRVPIARYAEDQGSGDSSAAMVAPLCGHDEVELADLQPDAAGARGTGPPIDFETALLLRALAEIDGRTPDADAVNALTLGDRNRLVLAALAATYGVPESLVMRCPGTGCGAPVDLPLDSAFFIGARCPRAASEEHRIVAAIGGRQIGIRFRVPTGHDVVASVIEARDDPSRAARRLLERCLLGVDGAEAAEIDRHRDTIAMAVESAMETLDPMAEVVLQTRCPECGGPVIGNLDPLSLIVEAMDRHGGILLEIDRLARAYHWSEADILALPATRRRHYLALIEASLAPPTRRRVSR
jgi:hypothetical protein